MVRPETREVTICITWLPTGYGRDPCRISEPSDYSHIYRAVKGLDEICQQIWNGKDQKTPVDTALCQVHLGHKKPSFAKKLDKKWIQSISYPAYNSLIYPPSEAIIPQRAQYCKEQFFMDCYQPPGGL